MEGLGLIWAVEGRLAIAVAIAEGRQVGVWVAAVLVRMAAWWLFAQESGWAIAAVRASRGMTQATIDRMPRFSKLEVGSEATWEAIMGSKVLA